MSKCYKNCLIKKLTYYKKILTTQNINLLHALRKKISDKTQKELNKKILT